MKELSLAQLSRTRNALIQGELKGGIENIYAMKLKALSLWLNVTMSNNISHD